METWDAIRARRDVRAFEHRAVDPDHLGQILEAARRTPSSRNGQPWDLVVVTDPDRLARLSEVWKGAKHIAEAPVAIAVVAPRSRRRRKRETIQYDLGQLSMSIALAATDLGVGTAHAAVRDDSLARELLGHPSSHRCMWLIGLGYPADRPLTPIRKPKRRDLDDIVHHEDW